MAQGGVPFVDISNPANMKRRDWNRSAPRWRRACPGLTFAGTCKHSGCEVNGQLVIHNCKFTAETSDGAFDLRKHAMNVKCPECRNGFVPSTCAFNNCEWKYSGTKFEWLTGGVQVSGEWQVADNAYHVFDNNVTVNWMDLKITSKRTGNIRAATRNA